ncbi:MAG: GIY-YIG nuclease family protein [bacterium]
MKTINDDKTFYKIGFTKGSVKKRITELQTGCPFKIEIVDTFDTEIGQVLEKTLHNLYHHLKTHGEWFELDITEEVNFKKLCEKYENIHLSLKKKDNI